MERRIGLKRGKPLKPGKALARTGRLKPGKRLAPVSDRRLAERPERAEMRDLVFTRDGRVCRLAGFRHPGWPDGCMGQLTVHHLRKEGQGGPYTLPNLLTLCRRHNDWVEEAPRALVSDLGLVMSAGETYPQIWHRLIVAGIVRWWWSGQATDPRLWTEDDGD